MCIGGWSDKKREWERGEGGDKGDEGEEMNVTEEKEVGGEGGGGWGTSHYVSFLHETQIQQRQFLFWFTYINIQSSKEKLSSTIYFSPLLSLSDITPGDQYFR